MDSRDTFRTTLRERRASVRNDILAAAQRINAEGYAAIADQVHDTKDQALRQLLADSDDAELKRAAAEQQDIDDALQRIDAGAYGRCSACGNAISPARLVAYPTAKRCLPCQTQHEHKR
jgi:RNA polymerase-binding transcription factor DksA